MGGGAVLGGDVWRLGFGRARVLPQGDKGVLGGPNRPGDTGRERRRERRAVGPAQVIADWISIFQKLKMISLRTKINNKKLKHFKGTYFPRKYIH